MSVPLSDLVAVVAAGRDEASGVLRPVAGSVGEPIIDDVEHDSRVVRPGALYACIPGAKTDGHGHAPAAVAAGAVALLVERPLHLGVPELVVADVRSVIGPVAAAVHGRPSEKLDLVGVTGTNGKTTTVRLLTGILRAEGRGVTEIGTLTGELTTPEATDLQRLFASALRRGDDTVAMEVSSHALDQRRVDGSRFRVAAFTNLGRDHLDHHGTVEAYFAAKARLFGPALADLAVIDVGSPHGRLLTDACEIPVITVDSSAVDNLVLGVDSSRFDWRGHAIELPVGGRFNVANAMLAAEIALVLGVAEADVAVALGAVPAVPGRFELVDEGQEFAVIVDYAHTPDGLEAVLKTARDVASGRLIVVFGAGGDRDREKRPRMGSVAREQADLVVVTSDNPRGEVPGAITAAIIEGMDTDPDVVELDRRLAIRHAITAARDGDLVVIAGKGHEPTQTTGAETVEFDDRIVARDEIRRLQERGP